MAPPPTITRLPLAGPTSWARQTGGSATAADTHRRIRFTGISTCLSAGLKELLAAPVAMAPFKDPGHLRPRDVAKAADAQRIMPTTGTQEAKPRGATTHGQVGEHEESR